MFSFKNYFVAESLTQAYDELQKNRKNIILGGTSYLRMGNVSYNTAIDLNKLNLSYIKEEEGTIYIGATTTFRDLETSPITQKYFDGILDKCVRGIIGVQFRSNVQVGATVFSKFGFSDLIPTLLAMNATVVLFKRGEISLEEYLEENSIERDILVEIKIKNALNARGSFQSVRKNKSDYAITNTCVTKIDDVFRVCIGVRPGKAKLVKKASQLLTESTDINDEIIKKAVDYIDEEISFGSNMRGSKEYREKVSKMLTIKAIKEVL